MASFSLPDLKARFNTYIKTNFLQLITGAILNTILHDIADSINTWLGNFILKADVKAGSANITPDGYDVVFTTPYAQGTNYVIMRHCTNEDGDVGYIISNRTVAGFHVTPVVNSFFEFKCYKI